VIDMDEHQLGKRIADLIVVGLILFVGFTFVHHMLGS
jgi:hypothetical protein